MTRLLKAVCCVLLPSHGHRYREPVPQENILLNIMTVILILIAFVLCYVYLYGVPNSLHHLPF